MVIKKCRWCDSDKLEIKPSEVMDGVYFHCPNCGYSSASAETADAAIGDWNDNN